ncbi:MAG: hypothetical protein HY293_19750 [Planctomycetes bacterium]|nr:hypothetical protein [Planctomycetota bacterium]
MRVDGTTSSGTNLRLTRDLDLPDEASIPIYGGGALGMTRHPSKSEQVDLLFVAEYWSHSWSGRHSLSYPETLGDHAFASGSTVDSRFNLWSLTLDAKAIYSAGAFRAGGILSVQARSATLWMDSPLVHASETIDDFYWGGGFFVDYRPIPYLFAGTSIKGFTSFGDAGETGAGDFRVYGGAEWGPFQLEGGYRAVVYDLALPDKALSCSLYGAYVAVSAIVRF